MVPGFSTLNTPPRWNSSFGGHLPETTQAVKEPLVSLDDSLVRSSGLPWQPPVSTGREGPQLLAALVPLPSIQWGQGGTHRPGHILAKGAPDRLGDPRKACLSKKTSGKVLLLADPPRTAAYQGIPAGPACQDEEHAPVEVCAPAGFPPESSTRAARSCLQAWAPRACHIVHRGLCGQESRQLLVPI